MVDMPQFPAEIVELVPQERAQQQERIVAQRADILVPPVMEEIAAADQERIAAQ